jgi:hypothetical protein
MCLYSNWNICLRSHGYQACHSLRVIFARESRPRDACTTELLRRLSTEVGGILSSYWPNISHPNIISLKPWSSTIILSSEHLQQPRFCRPTRPAGSSGCSLSSKCKRLLIRQCRNTTKPETMALLLGYSRRLRTLAKVSAFPLWP